MVCPQLIREGFYRDGFLIRGKEGILFEFAWGHGKIAQNPPLLWLALTNERQCHNRGLPFNLIKHTIIFLISI
jgi:hypothetical protein